MADEVTYKIRVEILISGEERLERAKRNLEDIQNVNKDAPSESVIQNQMLDASQELYSEEMDLVTKGFSMLAESMEKLTVLFDTLRETLSNIPFPTQTADMLQMQKNDKTPKESASETQSSDNSRKSYTNDTRSYLKEMDSETKGFSILAESMEKPTVLFDTQCETLSNIPFPTQTADMLQMQKNDKTPKEGASETQSSDNSQKSYPNDTRSYLEEMDSLTKGFATLAKSIESPITLFEMLSEALFDKAFATAEKADMLQMSEGQQRLPNTAKAMQETASIGGEVANIAAKGGSASSMASLGKVLGTASKALGTFGAVVGVAAIAVDGIDKALKKMNQQILAAGERMAMLAETGNVAGANLNKYDNSFKGAFLSSIPIVGALVRKNLVQDYANWTAFQPFAKLIPSLLDYKYSTGSAGSGADMAKKVTDETGLETGYDFATRFKVLGAMSEYVGKDNDAAVTRELLSNARALGLNPDMLVDLVGNAVGYSTDTFTADNNDVMTSIEKTAMDTGLDRSGYKELIRGFDDIIKKQLSVGVKVSVANVSEMASVLGQAGDVWKGERGLQIQMSMNERLRNAGNLTSDEDVALMQWTRGEGESYHDWRLAMDKGLTKERFATMAQRFTTETGNDIVTGNNMLANTFGISYTQADELRQLMTKMNNRSLNDTDREDARKSFQEKMNEIREGERPQELAYLERINTTMENATVDASGKLGSILEILQNWQNRDAPPDTLEEILEEIKEEIDSHDLVAQMQNKTGEIGNLLIEQNIKNEVTPYWKDDLLNKFDKNSDGKLDNEEMQEYGKYLDKIIDALKSLESLEVIKEMLKGGVVVE